jgi:hypothetical protein
LDGCELGKRQRNNKSVARTIEAVEFVDRFRLCLLIVAWLAIHEPCCSQPLNIESFHQLFLDNGVVESMSGLQRQVGAATKHSATPVLSRTSPWEAARAELYGSAVWNSTQQRYELFYSAMSQPYDTRLAIAYSTDTINWTKPSLNQYAFNGQSPTNLVYVLPQNDPGIQGQYASMGGWVHGPTVIYDAHEVDSSRRYKMITNAGNGYLNALFSPDGITWTSSGANPVINLTSDTGNSVLWDPEREKYVLYGRLRDASGVREVFRSESADFVQWTTPQLVYSPTSADRAQSLEFYGHSVTKYEGLYVGLTWMFPNTASSTNPTSDAPVTWPVLTVSRDGIQWQRVSDQPFIPLGLAGAFDHRQIRTASSLVVTDDKIVVMYSGSPHAHVASHNFDIGQASLPRDRFASLEAGVTPATLLTKPLEYRAGRLFINADIAADGYIRVGLVDAAGSPVPGYSGELSHASSGDSLRNRMWWNGHAFLAESAPAGSRLSFSMKNARLYSFWTEPVAPVKEIELTNANFDHDYLPADNQFNFSNPYPGWAEVAPATGLGNESYNVGPFNCPPSDLSGQLSTESNVLYYQQAPESVRVDQTSQHVIAASDRAFELSVQVGNDLAPGRFGGYRISLYADNGATKTILKTLSGADVLDDSLVERTLTLTDDVDLDLAPFVGQRLGLALSSLGLTYLNPAGMTVPGIVLYDSVRLVAIGSDELDPGDYNRDGIVDAADYLVWRDSQGVAGPGLVADGNRDGVVDSSDYLVWRTHFGNSPASLQSGTGADSQQPVPEAPAAVLIALSAITWPWKWTCRHSSQIVRRC